MLESFQSVTNEVYAVYLIDSHVHIDAAPLKPDLAAVLSRAQHAGIIAQVVPAIHAGNWDTIQSLCEQHDGLHPCYGMHPCFMDHHKPEHINDLARRLGRYAPVAVGECGLDYSVIDLDKGAQQKLFSAQLTLAREFRLPIIIHAYKAVEDVIRMVRGSGHYHGVVHSFNGSQQQAHRLIDLGYKLSFGGAVTYERATRLRELIKNLPLESFLLETDAPDQPDQQHQGQRNEPSYLVNIWQCISALRKESAEQVAAVTTQTASELFSLPVQQPA